MELCSSGAAHPHDIWQFDCHRVRSARSTCHAADRTQIWPGFCMQPCQPGVSLAANKLASSFLHRCWQRVLELSWSAAAWRWWGLRCQTGYGDLCLNIQVLYLYGLLHYWYLKDNSGPGFGVAQDARNWFECHLSCHCFSCEIIIFYNKSFLILCY